MDPVKGSIIVAMIAAFGAVIAASIAAWASVKTHTQVTRNSHKDPDKPTLPDRIGTVSKKVDDVGASNNDRFDVLEHMITKLATEQRRQGAQIRALWRHVRRPDLPGD